MEEGPQTAGLWRKAVINIGQRPTFGLKDSVLIEVHIIEASLDLYNQDLQVELDVFIRKEQAFSNILELTRAIKQDIKKVLSL